MSATEPDCGHECAAEGSRYKTTSDTDQLTPTYSYFNKLALLCGEALLCLHYDCLKKEK